MKKVLIIQGHPETNSLNAAISTAYQKGALAKGAEVQEIVVKNLDFDPSYSADLALEPDLQKAQKQILWANHIIIIHPLWWGGLPAQLKGFIDRVFLAGFAYKFKENTVWWDKLLKGRTGRIIYTMDQPYFYYNWVNGKPAVNQLKKMTMEFCGIRPTRTTAFGPVRNSTPKVRQQWLQKVEKLGQQLA